MEVNVKINGDPGIQAIADTNTATIVGKRGFTVDILGAFKGDNALVQINPDYENKLNISFGEQDDRNYRLITIAQQAGHEGGFAILAQISYNDGCNRHSYYLTKEGQWKQNPFHGPLPDDAIIIPPIDSIE